MENGPPTPGLDDGTIDVERLLGETQDGHESVDSVICFNEKIQASAMDMEDVSCGFGRGDAAIAQEGKDLDGEVLEVMPSDVGAGYYRLHSDFCGMGEDYLLGSGVDFDESITNLDYGSSGGLPASVSDSQMQVSSAGSDTAWKSDLFRVTEVPNCSSDQFNVQSSELSDIPNCHDCQMSVKVKPSISHGFASQNIINYKNSSNCSPRDTLSDENGGRMSPSHQIFCSLNTRKNNEFDLTGLEVKTKTCNGNEEEVVKVSGTDVLTTQKRSRKPTKRYIDELPDPVSTFSKKRRSSTVKDKHSGVKDKKKCPMGSKELRFLDEESSVKAIQVPFASLVNKECPKEQACHPMQNVDSRKLMPISKCKRVTPENQNEIVPAVARPKVKDDCAPSQKKRDACITTAVYKKKRNGRVTAASQKKRSNCIIDDSPKNRDDDAAAASPKKREDHFTAKQQKKRDCLTVESLDEASSRRKHHRLWTISEVKKLIDGVSQYGVGRWSRIKKLFFSSSAHRTSVDLKDKWRNLLKASGIQEQGSQQLGEKKRSVAWRPLPKSILRRVCELATLYPYPKGQRLSKTGWHDSNSHDHNIHDDDNDDDDSLDRSADITLSDYRRILRSINGS